MTTDDHIVFIVDDDERIREALGELLASHGMRAVASHRPATMSARTSPTCRPA